MPSDERWESAIREARRYGDDLPLPGNEATTCDWVIRPLLVALGYAQHEILAQGGDAAGQFPDYTVLPGTAHAWYLEAKAWSVRLEDRHVSQALNYAHQNGRRWVVLTNGRSWRLYDDRIHGTAADRLVAAAELAEVGFAGFLAALSPDAVRGGGLDAFANARRLAAVLGRQLADPDSPVVRAIVRELRRLDPPIPASGEDVCRIVQTSANATVAVAAPAAGSNGVGSAFPAPAVGAAVAGNRPAPSPEHSISRQPVGKRSPLDLGKGSFEPIIVYSRLRDIEGIARFENPGTVLLPGATLSRHPRPSCPATVVNLIADLLRSGKIVDRGDRYEVVQEIWCKSPSLAGALVAGGSVNGWIVWLDAQGRPIDLYRR